jgi:hypothetical protein
LQTLRHRLLTLHQDGERYTCDQAAPTAAFNPALATLGYLDPDRALIGLTSTGFRRVCLPLDFRQVVTALHEHDLLMVESPSRHTLKWPQLPDIQRRAYLYTLPMSLLTEQEAA